MEEKIERVKMAPGKYSLQRESDGVGDSGPSLVSLCLGKEEEDGKDKIDYIRNEIVVGGLVECGAIGGRSYAAQDYWRTSVVTEILSVNEDRSEVRFKTRNSIYTCKAF